MYGSMAMQNFTITGTLIFGVAMMDRGAIIADISDIQIVLDMKDASGEILGYFKNNIYRDEMASGIAAGFNRSHDDPDDEYAPVMMTLKEQNELASLIDYAARMSGIVIAVFVLAMSIVLWNAGLIGGLRRYGEIGVRLAIGENKGRVYRSMIIESVMVGIIGTLIGSGIGLGISYILEIKGINIGAFMKNATLMLPNVFRAHVTRQAYYIGFFPGLFSTVLGTSLSGIGIYRRKTAQLFKELEA
jgi:putative ABC transport system permease protein